MIESASIFDGKMKEVSVFAVFEGNVGATLQQKVNRLPRTFRRRKQQWRPLLGVYRIDFYPLTTQMVYHTSEKYVPLSKG